MNEKELDDLATLFKAAWDTSWGANNMKEVDAAYNRVETALEQASALRQLLETVAELDPILEKGEYALYYQCFYCDVELYEGEYREDAPFPHAANCLFTEARALLGRLPQEQQHE